MKHFGYESGCKIGRYSYRVFVDLRHECRWILVIKGESHRLTYEYNERHHALDGLVSVTEFARENLSQRVS